MAILVTGGALSHSPLMTAPPFPEESDLVEAYKAHARNFGAQIAAQKPDVIIVIAQDHMRSIFYDLMPPITIGTGKVGGWGDWSSREGERATDTELARHIHRHLMANGMDPACSYDLLVDHGTSQALDLIEWPRTLPVIPILINCLAAPIPEPSRAWRLGELLKSAIETFPGDRRVAVIGSGGLSHSPPAGNVEDEREEAREAVRKLIHGKPDVRANEAARRQGLIEAVQRGVYRGTLRPEWDRYLLDEFAAGRGAQLAQSLTVESILEDGGTAGCEILTWLASSAAYAGGSAREFVYSPLESTITGMGMMAFEPG